MKVCIIQGSPRREGNTNQLCKPFVAELKACGADVRIVDLNDKRILPCRCCRTCQQVSGEYGCPLADDAWSVWQEVIAADCFVLATPIYAWYCTAPMKALLDRHYGLNKYYGAGTGSLWAGKQCAILATYGYEREYAVAPFELGIQRLCAHSGLVYRGLYGARDTNGRKSMRTDEAVLGARAFARALLGQGAE